MHRLEVLIVARWKSAWSILGGALVGLAVHDSLVVGKLGLGSHCLLVGSKLWEVLTYITAAHVSLVALVLWHHLKLSVVCV